jgi:putative peptidoglycan binding protein
MPETTAQVRRLHLAHPPQTGPDVEALQQLLAPYDPGPVDGVYGPLTAAAVERAKWALGYPDVQCDRSAAPRLVDYLEGAPLPPAYSARAKERRGPPTLREAIVGNARWGIAHEPQIHYAELRPIDALREPRRLPLTTDCSGFVTLCYAWADAPDPNGLGYSGQGWTGTLLANLHPVAADAVQPGDLVVFGPPPGNHAAVVLESGADPLLCSHGQERGPLAIRFSAECRLQPPEVAWLRGL